MVISAYRSHSVITLDLERTTVGDEADLLDALRVAGVSVTALLAVAVSRMAKSSQDSSALRHRPSEAHKSCSL